MQKKNTQSLIVGVVLYAFIVFCWMCTNSFIGDASLFPRMILVLFAVLNTIMVVRLVIRGLMAVPMPTIASSGMP